MSGQISTILILGARGDLAGRLLLPAVGQLLMMEPGRAGPRPAPDRIRQRAVDE
ncbi:hypothetical protein AAGW05_15100 [Arthrobacter sp. LAPM80]|uniref:hypothetical protein n=1 Tax=Arthrobacter sp. LAPM80 TaxID=3141788 RepID=UPI00398A5924